MHDYQYKYLLKSLNDQLEIKSAPTINGGIIQFSGEAKTFLEAAYRSGGVMAEVKFICLERKSEKHPWIENDIIELDFTKWEMEDDLFGIKYTPLNS